MSENRRPSLPPNPNLEQLRKQAKDLLSDKKFPNLASAQLELARRYGFASWPKLKYAVELDTLRRLIADGDPQGVADLLRRSPKLVAGRFEDGDTPLHLAAHYDDPAVVEAIVRAGGDMETKFAESAHSALSWALTCRSFRAARKLVEMGSRPDLFCASGLGLMKNIRAFWPDGKLVNSPSRTGSSRYDAEGKRLPCPPEDDLDQVSDALYIACRCDRLEAAGWLLDHGADPNWRGYSGATNLAWAEFSGNPELCALLRERGGSDDLLDHEFQAAPKVFALMVPAGWGFPKKLLERLTADRALVHATGGCGTLLHAAAASDQRKCAIILISFGADRDALDPQGRTPAQVAEEKGLAQMVTLLTSTQIPLVP